MRTNTPTLIPNLLSPLSDPDSNMRKRAQLQRAPESFLNRIIPHAPKAPVYRQAWRIRQARRHSKGQFVKDFSRRVAVMIGGGIETGYIHGGRGKGRRKGEYG